MNWVGYCKSGELDRIKSLISLCTLALATTTVDHEDKRINNESFEKNIIVGESSSGMVHKFVV